MVREDAVVGTTVLPGIRLTDEDQVGDNIKVECEPISQVRSGSKERSTIRMIHQENNSFLGV